LYASEDEKVTIDEETRALIITSPDGTITSSSAPTEEVPATEAPANVEPVQEEVPMEAETMAEEEVG
jgi:hypothetical protein